MTTLGRTPGRTRLLEQRTARQAEGILDQEKRSSSLKGRKEEKRRGGSPKVSQPFVECGLWPSGSPTMILFGAYLLSGSPCLLCGAQACAENVAQGSPRGRRSHCGQCSRGSLVLLISHVGISEGTHEQGPFDAWGQGRRDTEHDSGLKIRAEEGQWSEV